LRYIHLNPLRAGIVADLAEHRYPWCGHQQLIGAATYQLLATTELLPLFAKRPKAAVTRYLDFLAAGLHAEQRVKLLRGGRKKTSRQLMLSDLTSVNQERTRPGCHLACLPRQTPRRLNCYRDKKAL
jgi:hypothetical protein